ncbi:MAG: glycerophosphodiester phosphodiesterase family protein [Candidatus Nanopelagicales bacterium]
MSRTDHLQVLPLVVAHRGSNEFEPEHSLAAYLRAVGEGADAIECDVRLTADGTLVCVHDRGIGRTSNGVGSVSAMRLKDLLRFDFSDSTSSWQGTASALDARRSVLTLRVLLASMLDASSTIQFSIETKHPTRYGGYVEKALVDDLHYFGLVPATGAPSRVRVMSFSAMAMRRMAGLAPTLPTVFLMDRISPARRGGSLPGNARIAGISIASLEKWPEYVAAIHARHGEVHVWTVNEPQQVELCRSLGVDAIISDRPGMVRELLR